MPHDVEPSAHAGRAKLRSDRSITDDTNDGKHEKIASAKGAQSTTPGDLRYQVAPKGAEKQLKFPAWWLLRVGNGTIVGGALVWMMAPKIFIFKGRSHPRTKSVSDTTSTHSSCRQRTKPYESCKGISCWQSSSNARKTFTAPINIL